MYEMYQNVEDSATYLRETAVDMRRYAESKERRAAELDEEAASLRGRADALRLYARQYDDSADALAPRVDAPSTTDEDDPTSDDDPALPTRTIVRFKTVGSVYEIDEAARTWVRTPHAHGPSGYLPKDSGSFESHTPVSVGLRTIIRDTAIGTFGTSAVQEILP